ncbi:hypothetical protein [Streptomyces rubiginosohelvolus]|uniref:YD repeat-containing protein n=1 Tax=Streptomyces rubiginosohelvolus TaxID=67362 RepID=A0ABW6ESG8_9ACTN
MPSYAPPGGTVITDATSRTTYDAAGRIATTPDPLDRTTRYGYDQFDNLVSRTDPPATTPSLDPPVTLGEPTDLGPNGGTTRYAWTPTGLQLSVTDPTGARTEATYDELGRELTTTAIERYPALQNLTSRYTWDDADNQTTRTTAVGHTTTATYNAAGDTTTFSDAYGTTRFAYDRLGRPTETTDATGRMSRTTYDSMDNVTAIVDYGKGATPLRSWAATFDLDGNNTTTSSPEGAHTERTFNALGHITGQTEKATATKSTNLSSGTTRPETAPASLMAEATSLSTPTTRGACLSRPSSRPPPPTHRRATAPGPPSTTRPAKRQRNACLAESPDADGVGQQGSPGTAEVAAPSPIYPLRPAAPSSNNAPHRRLVRGRVPSWR